MIGKSSTRMRLCPHCANSIEEDATNCSYCKTDLLSQPFRRRLKRDEPSSEQRLSSDIHKRSSIPPKFIWTAAMLVTALIAFFAGWYIQRNQLLLSTASEGSNDSKPGSATCSSAATTERELQSSHRNED